jgi:hypothetical protein
MNKTAFSLYYTLISITIKHCLSTLRFSKIIYKWLQKYGDDGARVSSAADSVFIQKAYAAFYEFSSYNLYDKYLLQVIKKYDRKLITSTN